MARFFFAVPIDAALHGAIAEAVRPLKQTLGDSVRWSPTEYWHITLRFLGAATPSVLQSMTAVAKELVTTESGFHLTLRKINLFPSQRSKVLAVYIGQHLGLHRLVEGLTQASQQLGLSEDRRRFRPHITLGRTENHFCLREPIWLPDLLLPVTKIALYESRPVHGRSCYVKLQEFNLRDV